MAGVATCPGCGRVLREVNIGAQAGTCVRHGAGQRVRWVDGGGASLPHEWLYLPKPPPRGYA